MHIIYKIHFKDRILNDIKPTMYKDEFKVTHSSVHKLDLSKNKIERIY